jgi:hypothetical protein
MAFNLTLKTLLIHSTNIEQEIIIRNSIYMHVHECRISATSWYSRLKLLLAAILWAKLRSTNLEVFAIPVIY